MWITREQYNDLRMEVEEQRKKLEKLSDMLGYEKKKKPQKKPNFVFSTAYYFMKQDGFRVTTETREEFIDRLIAEHEEKQRLIKLASEVEKGMKLKGKA